MIIVTFVLTVATASLASVKLPERKVQALAVQQAAELKCAHEMTKSSQSATQKIRQQVPEAIIKRAIHILQEYCPREYLTILQGGKPGLCLHPTESLSPESQETQIELAYQFARFLLRRPCKEQGFSGYDDATLDVLIKAPTKRSNDHSLTLADCLKDDEAYRIQTSDYFKSSLSIADFKQLAERVRTRNLQRLGFVHPKIKEALNPKTSKYILHWMKEGGKIRTFLEKLENHSVIPSSKTSRSAAQTLS